MKKKLLFIIKSEDLAKNRFEVVFLKFYDSFVKAGYGPSVYITQGPKDAEYQAARAKTKELVVCGRRDGTLNEVVSGLMTITPEGVELGYIPSGSTNDFASSLGLPEKYAESSADQLHWENHFWWMSVYSAKTGISSMWRRSEHLRRYPIRPAETKNILGHQAGVCWKPSNT